jgi:tetratricopeptide (TPR) repeat protein
MTAIAKAFHADGSRSDALAVLAEATTIVKKQQEPARSFDTAAVAEAYAAVGEPELAMQRLSEPLQRPDPLSYWSILSALGAIAKSFHAMGDGVGTQETLAVALNLARNAPQGSAGLSFWPSLVRYHVAVDLEEQATDIARGISDERVRHDALTAIIRELRSAGKTELARDLEARFLHDGLLPPPDAHVTERLQSDSITTSEEAEQRIDSLPTLRQRTDAYARLAQRFAAAGQVATASRLLDRAIAVAQSLPDDGVKVSTLMAAAAVWDNFGDSRRARRFLAEARIALDAASKDLDTPEDTASSLGLSLARSYAKAGYYDLAIRTARGIRSLAPRIHAFVEIAQALHRKGNPGRAVTVIDEVLPLISRVAQNSPTRLAAAEALADLGEGALALDVIQATVLDEPRIPGARMWAARICLQLRRYPDAIQLLNHALSSESHSAERYRANVRDLVLIALTIAETPPNSPEQTHAILHRVIRLADLPTGNRT